MSVQPWRNAQLVRTRQMAPQTWQFWFEVPELEQFDFTPGQFITLDLPIHEKPNKRWRSYSIASWPDKKNQFELVIVRKDEGPGTSFLFDETKPGSVIPYRGPQGVFILPETLDRDLFLICTGTGIAPFRSMIRHIFKNDIPHQRVFLVFGTRTRDSLLYHDEFRELEKQHPEFSYHPVLSRENWEGAHGYVHDEYARLLGEKKPAYFFLCGWKQMIAEAKQHIMELGYDKQSIHQEIYG